ncbi:hypothetical protein AMS68_004387 [Peltaster fructicola]|uniref:histone acetyltransferase n=1 Tax=Peltaster fructicola TaxID=286661 RepID=A0A6H0XWQ8_9PEZI|nr:hypothetical protein AMS68_004387 [Peltaster fructicola]
MPATLQSPKKAPAKRPLQPNVVNVVLGNLAIKPWFPSFYPKEQVEGDRLERLYVCQWCFKYTHEIMKYCAHCKVCPQQQEPVGDSIYEKDGYAIHELDGEEHKMYAQNLSLFAKLFLDTKSVFFDVSSFLYYTLVSKQAGEEGQVVGFFSKEKMSWDNNNVACILVFPPWQRKGLGQILMGASYELGRREDRFGGPERPLSGPGQRGYTTFWCGEVCRHILRTPAKKTVTIKDISDATWILPDDIILALKEMDVYEQRKAGGILIHKSKVRAWAEQHGVSKESPVDVGAFIDMAYETGSES